MALSVLKERIGAEVDKRAELLVGIAQEIHANPELGFEEHRAVALLTAPLAEAGFHVRQGVAGLATAFTAEWSGGPGPTVALVAEYDALKGLGHACGHNLIGTAAVGAALALKSAVPDLAGTVKVIGTPAEEGGGGKVIMVEKGVFDGLDAALLCHPGSHNTAMRGGLAAVHCTFQYFGVPAHAAIAPEQGISALDAVLQLFAGINQLRQFAPDPYRIHGIIRHGGEAPNVIPAFASAEFIIRAANRQQLNKLKEKVFAVARGAAVSTGARLEIKEGFTYAEREENEALSSCFLANLQRLGLATEPAPKSVGSSDMGNVGEVCPMAHPYVKIAEPSVDLHTAEFAAAAGSERGMQGLLTAAKALAMTVLDVCTNESLRNEMQAEFLQYRRNAGDA